MVKGRIHVLLWKLGLVRLQGLTYREYCFSVGCQIAYGQGYAQCLYDHPRPMDG